MYVQEEKGTANKGPLPPKPGKNAVRTIWSLIAVIFITFLKRPEGWWNSQLNVESDIFQKKLKVRRACGHGDKGTGRPS